jgi:hypothetical protein
MKLDPDIHIVMHSVFFLKPGVTRFKNLEDHLLIKTNNEIWLNGLYFCAPREASNYHAMHYGVTQC